MLPHMGPKKYPSGSPRPPTLNVIKRISEGQLAQNAHAKRATFPVTAALTLEGANRHGNIEN